jgi:hypothetical protein
MINNQCHQDSQEVIIALEEDTFRYHKTIYEWN